MEKTIETFKETDHDPWPNGTLREARGFILSERAADGTLTHFAFLTSEGELVINPTSPSFVISNQVLQNFQVYLKKQVEDTSGTVCKDVLELTEQNNEWIADEIARVEAFAYFVGGGAIVLSICILAAVIYKMIRRGEEDIPFQDNPFK